MLTLANGGCGDNPCLPPLISSPTPGTYRCGTSVFLVDDAGVFRWSGIEWRRLYFTAADAAFFIGAGRWQSYPLN